RNRSFSTKRRERPCRRQDRIGRRNTCASSKADFQFPDSSNGLALLPGDHFIQVEDQTRRRRVRCQLNRVQFLIASFLAHVQEFGGFLRVLTEARFVFLETPQQRL